MAGPTGKGRGRPPKGRVAEMKASESPVRRNTRQQQPRQDDTIPEEHDLANIDPSLTGPIESSPPAPSHFPIPRRGVRRDMDRDASFGPSLHSGQEHAQSETYSSQPGDSAASNLSVGAGQVWSTPPRHRFTSASVSEANGTPAWEKKKKITPQRLARLWDYTKPFHDRLSEHNFPLNTARIELSDEDKDWLEDWSEEREGLLRALEGYRRHFLENPADPVIHPTYVTDALAITGSAEGVQASRKIFATNYAILLDGILRIDEQDPLPWLQSCDSWFPQVFFGDSEDCAGQTQEILDMVIGIRTQLVIYTLKALDSPELDAKITAVAKIFYGDTTSPQDIRRDSQALDIQIKRIPFINLEAGDNADIYRQLYTDRVSALVSSLDESEPLEEQYDIYDFLEKLREFVQTNFKRLEAAIEGNSSQPVASFVVPDASRVESQQIESQLEADTLAHRYRSVEPGSSNGDAYMSSQQYPRGLTSQVVIDTAHTLQSSAYPSSAPYPRAFEHVGPHAIGSMYAQSAAQVAGTKRTAADVPTPALVPGLKRRRKRNTAQATAPPPVASTMVTTSGAVDQQYPEPFRSQIEPPDFAAVSQRAKQLSAEKRKVREPQVRSPWVQPDIRALIAAVHEYKCKWSAIQRAIERGEIHFERRRDQQALRDKARLLKQDFLKADANLPPSFDLVVLGKKERDAVIACERNPDRKEADVDEEGKPTNTIWLGASQAHQDDVY